MGLTLQAALVGVRSAQSVPARSRCMLLLNVAFTRAFSGDSLTLTPIPVSDPGTNPHARADVDRFLMGFTSMFLRSVLQLGSTVVLIGAVTPFALPPLVPIMLLFYFLYLYLCAVTLGCAAHRALHHDRPAAAFSKRDVNVVITSAVSRPVHVRQPKCCYRFVFSHSK